MRRINRGMPLAIVGVVMALFIGFIQAPVTASAAATGTVTPSSFKLAHQLRLRNKGKTNIIICENWMYVDAVHQATKCKDSRIGTLGSGKKSYKAPLRWPDVDAVRVPKGYSLYREKRGLISNHYKCVFAATDKAWFVKISPDPLYTGTFATNGDIMVAKSHLGEKSWTWSGGVLDPCSK